MGIGGDASAYLAQWSVDPVVLGSQQLDLPSERAVSLGGYGAIIQSSKIGPKGGQVLVEETCKTFNELWPKKK